MTNTTIKTDYNIEFAHIYSNESPSREHSEGAWIMNRTRNRLEQEGYKVVSSVMIDEYNPTESILNIQDFVKFLADSDTQPDFIVNESDLVQFSDVLISSIEKSRLQKSNDKYIKVNGKVPCSLLVAVWHLLRLGALDFEDDLISVVTPDSDASIFRAHKVISVLPERFRGVEETAVNIIKHSAFKAYHDKIEHIYF